MPGASAGNRYAPTASLTVVAAPTSDGLRASTTTPGNAPPVASLTTPSIEPRVSCARTGDAQARTTDNAYATRLTCNMTTLHRSLSTSGPCNGAQSTLKFG